MDFDFELFLTTAVLLSGGLALYDIIWLAPKRKLSAEATMPKWADYARSFFPVLLLVFCLRSFLIETFRIPSGSLKPTLVVGDFILTSKFAYGIRLPVIHTKLVDISEPKVGDIVVFHWPVLPSKILIKRVIGTPGDKISYINKVLYVNGIAAPQTLVKNTEDGDEQNYTWPVIQHQENLVGVKHDIYIRQGIPAQDFDVVVPAGEYFVMGDNRDDSNDSRYWGFVPEHNLIGKAFAIWLSWDSEQHTIRWKRLGSRINSGAAS